ncbi:hypothetical protein NP233_g12409 [Leucocoprinus birnbaumii]|uniref:Uncharacterized protein n=1 Tax=Leucocoprinus birnbaumii TaxID=56174 RepID=A0AAD5VGD5_9AGAR|nr:hypothetical protein NP233_g12409 [Leucocoprinus birnbaumii]
MAGILGKIFKSSKRNAPNQDENAGRSQPPLPSFDTTSTPTGGQEGSVTPQPAQPVYDGKAWYADPEDMVMDPQPKGAHDCAGRAAGYDNAISVPTRTAGIEQSFLAYGYNNIVQGPSGDHSNTKFTNSFVAKGRQNTILPSDSPLVDQAIALALARQEQARHYAQQSGTTKSPTQSWQSDYYPELPQQVPNVSAPQLIAAQAAETEDFPAIPETRSAQRIPEHRNSGRRGSFRVYGTLVPRQIALWHKCDSSAVSQLLSSYRAPKSAYVLALSISSSHERYTSAHCD